eukprot:2667950-Alexandrium_andersonii.AAC.1
MARLRTWVQSSPATAALAASGSAPPRMAASTPCAAASRMVSSTLAWSTPPFSAPVPAASASGTLALYVRRAS